MLANANTFFLSEPIKIQVFKDTAVIKPMYYSYLIYKMNFFP